MDTDTMHKLAVLLVMVVVLLHVVHHLVGHAKRHRFVKRVRHLHQLGCSWMESIRQSV